MTWTLIATTIIYPQYSHQSATASTVHVPGFKSLEACNTAGKNMPVPSGDKNRFDYRVEVLYVCVPMGDE